MASINIAIAKIDNFFLLVFSMSKNLEAPRSEPGMTGGHGRLLPVVLFLLQRLGRVGAGGAVGLPEDGGERKSYRGDACKHNRP